MKIGILGTGTVGKALGKGFAANGYDVKIQGLAHQPKQSLLNG